MIIAVTGHRPDKLWGYNYEHPNYTRIINFMSDFLNKNEPTHCISGVALGIDTLFAVASINYRNKNKGKNIIFECAIPCRNHTSKWKQEDKSRYLRILEEADIITKVSNEPYQPWLMIKRDEYMVDKCDLLLAFWNGDKEGGTYNTVKYAQKINKKIIIINPFEII